VADRPPAGIKRKGAMRWAARLRSVSARSIGEAVHPRSDGQAEPGLSGL